MCTSLLPEAQYSSPSKARQGKVAVINQHARRERGHDIVGSAVGLGNLRNGQNGHQSPLSFNADGSFSRRFSASRLGFIALSGDSFLPIRG